MPILTDPADSALTPWQAGWVSDDHETHRVTVVAHRGASRDYPEHTLEAYVRAIDVGADALECDVRLTADEQLVCVHDPTVQRTSNGRGRVSSMTLAQLRQLTWGTASEGPLTLRELFELTRDCGRRVELAIETKHPTRFGGTTERVLADLLDWFGWLPPDEDGRGSTRFESPSPARVMSFSVGALRRMRARSAGLPLVHLLDKPVRYATTERLPVPGTALGIDLELVRQQPDWVAGLRAAGHPLHVWTVDNLDDVDLCRRAGAGTIITNRPAEVLAHLHSR